MLESIELISGQPLRSAPQERVSKDGHEHHVCCPSFETPCFARLLSMRWISRRYAASAVIVSLSLSTTTAVSK